MSDDISVQCGGDYGKSLGYANQTIRFVNVEEWVTTMAKAMEE